MPIYLKEARPYQDPDAILDYSLDYSDPDDDYLGDDTIATSTWTVEDGMTIVDESNTTTTTTVWLTGGTVHRRYAVTNHIVTAAGREDERTFHVLVTQR